jgi:hypothetical protein
MEEIPGMGINFYQLTELHYFPTKPSYAGAKLFNTLPIHLKQLEENKFKRGLRCWLMEESIYTIGEFLESN